MIPARLLVPLALLLAPTIAVAQDDTCPPFLPGGTPPAFANPRLAQGAVLLCNDGFAVATSSVTRGALWSAERLTRASVEAARRTPRENRFHPDARLPPGSRAELADYAHSGFDRGHMAPSGDMPTDAAQKQSFSLANMVPQTPVLNRGPWERIESATRRLARRRGELYVVTGPAFIGAQIDTIGDNRVLVPTATWKAIHDPRAQAVSAYLCTNTDRPACQVLSIDALAGQVGIDPFPGLPAPIRARLLPLRLPDNGAGGPRRPVQPRREHGVAAQQP